MWLCTIFHAFATQVTAIVLSGSPITKDPPTYYCVFGKVYVYTKYICVIAASMY